jgi:hypothetical protein
LVANNKYREQTNFFMEMLLPWSQIINIESKPNSFWKCSCLGRK